MRSFTIKGYIIFFVTLSVIIAGCSNSSKVFDTYLKFSVEGEEYELNYIVFDILKLNDDNWHFIGLGQDPMKVNVVTSIPSGGIQWWMALRDTEELQGREINLSDLKDDRLLATVEFTLT